MSDALLGRLCGKYAQRDAIHVAICPATAGETLEPGEWAKIDKDGVCMGARQSDAHGIVDPFLMESVEKVQRFYLCLKPNAVNGMRHHWSHPEISDSQTPATDKSESEKWLMEYAERVNHYDSPTRAFERLIESLRDRELFFYGSDLHGFHDIEKDADDLRFHAERYLGIKINWNDFTFSCSC